MKNIYSYIFFLGFSAFLISNCTQTTTPHTLNQGIWRGVFTIPLEKPFEVPINFEIKKDKNESIYFEFINGEERIKIDDISINNDTIKIEFPVYETFILATFSKDEIKGNWVMPRKENYAIPFYAKSGNSYRFEKNEEQSKQDFSGKWKTVFKSGEERTFAAIGEFSQKGNKVTGTFQTESGDFRYLDGNVKDDEFMLSNFDGAHIYLFSAKFVGKDSLSGNFFSGKHYKTTWVAKRDNTFQLADPNTLTKLKEGYSKIDFQIEDQNGKIISPENPEFLNKIRIITISGTWCPNCMDEAKFLVEFLNRKNNPDIKVIGLSFERYDDKNKAYKLINTFKKKFGINYDVLFAGNPKNAEKILPMIEKIMSFPTMIIIDKKGEIRKIHTGFYGPATSKYTEFKNEFEIFIDELLKE